MRAPADDPLGQVGPQGGLLGIDLPGGGVLPGIFSWAFLLLRFFDHRPMDLQQLRIQLLFVELLIFEDLSHHLELLF